MKIFFLFFILSNIVFAEGKFLLLLGPSGVGKSTIINELKKIDGRFTYVTPFTTRPLRPGEVDKISISRHDMLKLNKGKKLLVMNEIYDILYGTPKDIIEDSLANSFFPVLDWPIDKISVMDKNYNGRIVKVYIAPPGEDELLKRLANDCRDEDGKRFRAAKSELKRLELGDFDNIVDFVIVNDDYKVVSRIIYERFIQCLDEQ